jgi:hypothetical protein
VCVGVCVCVCVGACISVKHVSLWPCHVLSESGCGRQLRLPAGSERALGPIISQLMVAGRWMRSGLTETPPIINNQAESSGNYTVAGRNTDTHYPHNVTAGDSYCERHLRYHNNCAPYRKHVKQSSQNMVISLPSSVVRADLDSLSMPWNSLK